MLSPGLRSAGSRLRDHHMDLTFLDAIDREADVINGVSDYVWDNPETAFTEFKSAAKIMEALKQEGFAVESGLAGIETAFKGTFGHGKPVIGVLGEFDALSGLGQESGALTCTPNGQPCGHGCGHNLLGAGALGAAIGIKSYLETTGHEGTVIYFGCPGEEGGSGKAFMAKEHVFDGVDAALTWHPSDKTEVRYRMTLANCQVLYRFDGLAAHAGAKPHLGRSALDAVELMNVGANYLREHIIQEARLHYAITNAGGYSPNVVQAHAEVLYLIRAPRFDQAKEIYERVNDIAKGAALMTGTKSSYDYIKGCSNCVLNSILRDVAWDSMHTIGVPEPTAEEMKFYEALTKKSLQAYPHDDEHPLHWELKEKPMTISREYGSTDVGDVSWNCPTVEIAAAVVPFGAPGHSWAWTTCGKQPYAYKALAFISKSLALTGAKLFEDPSLIEAAQAEFKEAVKPTGYICPIPDGVKPRAMTSFLK